MIKNQTRKRVTKEEAVLMTNDVGDEEIDEAAVVQYCISEDVFAVASIRFLVHSVVKAVAGEEVTSAATDRIYQRHAAAAKQTTPTDKSENAKNKR